MNDFNMNNSYVLRMLGRSPFALSDNQLLTQIVALSHALRFARNNKTDNTDSGNTRQNYETWARDHKLQPLIDEVWRRAERGSAECTKFLTVAAKAIERSSEITKQKTIDALRSSETFILEGDRIRYHVIYGNDVSSTPAKATKMNEFCGLPAQGLPTSDLSAVELIGEILKLSKLYYIRYSDQERGRVLLVDTKAQFGGLLCSGELQPLLEELAHRAEIAADGECARFLRHAAPVIGACQTGPLSEAAFINNVNRLGRIPEIAVYLKDDYAPRHREQFPWRPCHAARMSMAL